MIMEFKSQICTSVEQSKRLLELGLKKETADCHILNTGVYGWQYSLKPYSLAIKETEFREPKLEMLPAWSMHRLMMIAMKGDKLGCITHNIHQNNVATYYELVISSIEHLIKIDEFNKDYLEEKL